MNVMMVGWSRSGRTARREHPNRTKIRCKDEEGAESAKAVGGWKESKENGVGGGRKKRRCKEAEEKRKKIIGNR
jgi:hypothetical protein